MNFNIWRRNSIICMTVLLAPALSGCGFTCDEDSEGVRYARTLSQERLAKLYYDMEEFSSNHTVPISGYSSHDEERAFPDQFSDLQVARIRPHEGNIMVQGCFDHYVYLEFEGIGQFKDHYPERRIVLGWGEHEDTTGSEVLWQESASSTPNSTD